MRRKATVLAGIALLASACIDISFDPIVGPPEPAVCGYYCIDFAIFPLGGFSRMLTGDTMSLEVYSTEGHDSATWKLSGNGLAFVSGNALVNEITQRTNRVLVKGVVPGSSIVHAQAKDTTLKAQTVLTVADSSVITKVTIVAGLPATIPVGNTLYMSVALTDAAGLPYKGMPTALSISDTTVLQHLTGPAYAAATVVSARGVGTTDVTVHFLDLSHTVRITVTP